MRGFLSAVILLTFAFHTTAHAGNIHLEKEYQNVWCLETGGVSEYTLEDRTRVDCLTDEYAVEVDFAAKWAEAVGQALYYALMTGKRPGVLLIIEGPSDMRHLKRILAVSDKTGITVWTMGPEDLGAAPANRVGAPGVPRSHR